MYVREAQQHLTAMQRKAAIVAASTKEYSRPKADVAD